MPAWLGRTILDSARAARQSKSLGKLGDLLGDINTLAKTRGGFKLLGKARDAAELRRFARFAETFGEQSAALFRAGGRAAVEVAQKAQQYGKPVIIQAAAFGQGGLRLLDKVGALKYTKLMSRVAKIGYKGDAVQLIAKALLQLPRWVLLALIGLAAAAWLPWKKSWAFARRQRSKASSPA